MNIEKSRAHLIIETIKRTGAQSVRDMFAYAGNNPSQYINSVLRRKGWDLPDTWQTSKKGTRYKLYHLSQRDIERFDALTKAGRGIA